MVEIIEDDPDIPYFKYSYDSDYKKKNKFKKTTNARHVEMNRTPKRQKYKLQKGIMSAKKKDLLMLCKKGLTSKQDHAFFDWLPVTASRGKKDDIYSNSDSDSEEYESSETH